MQVYVEQSFECLKILTTYYVNEQLTLILDLYTFLKSDIPWVLTYIKHAEKNRTDTVEFSVNCMSISSTM